MKLRLALVAMLAVSSFAGADPGEGPRAPAPPARPAAPARPTFPTIAFRPAEREGGREARTETTVVVPARARLELMTFSGDIVVSAWDRNALRVQARHGEDTRVGVQVGPAAVTVRARRVLRVPDLSGRGRVRHRDVDLPAWVSYRVTVPRTMDLRLQGVNTQILVDGVEGDVIAESVNGPVALRGGRGNIRVGTINGGVEVVGARGSIEANSVSDVVVLREVEGPLRVETVRGNVELARVLSEAIEASTVSGALRYEGSIQPGGEYHFESHSGDVTVVLPERPDVAVSVSTYSGGFASSFPIQLGPALTPVRERGKEFDFTLGDGRAELSLESFSGVIRLARVGEAAGQVPRFEIRKDR